MDWGALRGKDITIACGDYNGAGETLAMALSDLRERVERWGGRIVADAPRHRQHAGGSFCSVYYC